jgi:hypothetical protein
MFKAAILPYDIYERHRKVGELIDSAQTILDVGGQLNMLSLFCKAGKITVANISDSEEMSDVEIKGDSLPFKNSSFEVVCAIDVLEHIPSAKRQLFVKDLLRVANHKAVLSFPIGTDSHKEYEKKLQANLSEKGLDVTYLNEHIKFGLPTHREVKEITKNLSSKKYFSGDITLNKILFNIYLFDPKVKYVRKIIYYLKLIFNLISNPVLYPVLSGKTYSKSINRIYLVIEK